MTRTNRRNGAGIARAALALAVLATAGGCAGYKPFYKEPKAPDAAVTYEFKIVFKGACPDFVEADTQNCPPKNGAVPKDCARVKGLDSVRFYPDPATAPPSPTFVLQFDPFGKVPIPVAGEVTLATEKVPNPNPDAPKAFTFIVKGPSSSCKVVDPQIILD